MFAVKFNFLAGRYHNTPWGHHVNEDTVEWPPSLWRFMRALISVWKSSCPAEITQEQMSMLLNKLNVPPKYFVPPAVLSHTRHFMPTREGKKEGRALIFDSFMSLSSKDSVYMIWDDVDLSDEEGGILCKLLGRLNYLGRSESWCSASLCEKPPEPNCVPSSGNEEFTESIELLIPRREQNVDIEQLCVRTSELRKRGFLYPPGSELHTYVYKEIGLKEKKEKDGAFRRKLKPELALYAVAGPVKPMITEALVVAETTRAALQDHYGRLHGGQSSPLFSGKDKSGRPLEGHLHAYFLPLDEDRDGKIDHILVYRSGGFDVGEQMALERLEVLSSAKGYSLKLGLLRIGSGEGLDISVLSSSKIWESITPFMLVRHPHWKRGKDTPVDQLKLELQRKGFPKPVAVKSSKGYLKYRHVSWLDYKRFRARYKPAYNFPYGFVIQFEDEVRGPIVLGYACHFGLGLFVPVK